MSDRRNRAKRLNFNNSRRVAGNLAVSRAAAFIVEPLERRVLLSTINWVGTTGDWDTAGNWSGGVVPGYYDTATIPSGANVTISTADGTVSINSVTTAAGSAFTVQPSANLSVVSMATIGGTFNLNGLLEGSAPSITLAGTTVVEGTIEATTTNTGSLTFNDGSVIALTFVNNGTVTITNGMVLGSGGTFTNSTGGTVNVTDDAGFIDYNYPLLTGGTFINEGNFNQTGGTGTDVFETYPADASEAAGGDFENNGGTIDIESGNFQVFGEAQFQGGQINVATGSVFAVDNGDPASPQDVYVGGTLTGSGGGHILFNSGSFFPETEGETATPATLDFPAGYLTVGQVTFNSIAPAYISNTGDINFDSTTGYGLIALDNKGTVESTGTSDISIGGGGAFTNETTGVINLETNAGFGAPDGNFTQLTNSGTIEKTGGSGTSVINVSFLNTGGTLDVGTGTLSFQSAISLDAGPIAVATGAVLNFNNGNHLWLDGTFTSTGGGTVTLSSGFIAGPSSDVNQNLNDSAILDFGPNTFQIDGGYLDDSGNVGTDAVVNEGSIYISSGTVASFTNRGSVYFEGLQLAVPKGSAIVNSAAGVLDYETGTTVVTGVNCHIQNKGTILVNAGSGELDLATPYPFSIYSDTNGIINTGTVEVASGTLLYPAVSVGANSGTIDAGETYKVDAGAALITDTADHVTTNNGTVILGGANSTFHNIAGLAINTGTFRVGSSASFTTAGSLVNSGTLVVGGNLAVNGNLTESGSASVLEFAVGAAPGTSGAPDLSVSGSTALAGDLSATFANGFAAGAGASYRVATFATASAGAFASTAGTGPDFTPVVKPTHIQLNSTGSGAADLDIGTITAPSTGSDGSAATITWPVSNIGSTAATGPWEDSVYLTTDGTIDASSILLGRVDQAGPVAANAGYTGTLTTALPAVPAGNYKIVVLVDSGDVVSDSNRANNQGVSSPLTISVPALTLGSTTNGTINDGQDILYRLTVAAGADVNLAASFATGDEAGIYVSYGAIPSPTSSQESVTASSAISANLLIPVQQAGNYYVLLQGDSGAGAGPAFSLTPTAAATFGVQTISPNNGGNAGSTTIQIAGTGFTGATRATLVSGSISIPASSVQFVSGNEIQATFNLAGQSIGSYGVEVANGANNATLASAFNVQAVNGNGLQFNLAVPSASRGDLAQTMYLDYTNTGNTNIPAPYFFISEPDTKFKLAGDTYSDTYLEVMGIGTTGNAGILTPGESGSIPITYRQITIIDDEDVTFNVSNFDTVQGQDLSDLQSQLQPATEPSDAWAAIFGNFVQMVSSNPDGLVGVLRNAATALGNRGDYTPDPNNLTTFALQQADNFGQITQRYALGIFGRGQGNPYAQLSVDGGGNVTVNTGAGTAEQVFNPQTNGTYQGLAGESDQLTLSNGVYTLTEPTGQFAVFKANGSLNYFQDTNGNRETANYSNGELTSLVSSDGDTYSYAYNSFGRVSQVTDPEGRITTYSYDSTGQLLMSTTNSSGTTSYTYYSGSDAADDYAITSIAYPNGTHQYDTYDQFGRLISQSLDNNSQTVTYAYDNFGDVTSTDALGNTQTATLSEDQGNIVSDVTDGLGNVARVAYDEDVQPTSTTTPGGLTTTTAYNSDGNPTSVTNPLGNTTNYSYNPTLDELLSVTDPNGNQTSYTYDASGNVTSMTDAGGNTTTYAYGSTGNITQQNNPNSTGATDTYNAKNLLKKQTYSDGTTITYTYDAHRNLLSVADSATGTVTYTYNSADQIASVSYPGGLSLTYTYNGGGQLTKEVDQTGFATNYSYTPTGQLSQLTDASGNVITTYAYNAAGNLAQANNANGTYTTYAYDADNRLVDVVNHAPGGAVNSSFAYTYNANGLRTSMASTAGTTTYTYDADGQLTQVVIPGGRTITYTYDAVGDRTEVSDSAASPVTYSANNLDEYTTVGNTTYTYDKDGNLLSTTTGSTTTTYTYNAEGELASETTPTDGITYQYDGQGARISSTDNGVTTDYLIDPSGNSNVIGTFTSAGAVLDQYVYGMGLTSQVNSSGVSSFYDFDGTGNTADLTDSSGAVASSYSYLPFGETLGSTGPTNLFTYGGQYGVQNTGAGLYFMRARSYDPTTGRFTQHDPLGINGGSTNLFSYAGNDPVNENDPTGKRTADVNPNDYDGQTENTSNVVTTQVTLPDGSIVIAPTNQQAAQLNAGMQNPETIELINIYRMQYGVNPDIYALNLYVNLGKADAQNNAGSWIHSYYFLRTGTRYYNANDPNDIFGPAGYGSSDYVPVETLPYEITFENDPTAGAPAKVVTITEQLDSNLDWTTFQLGNFGFGAFNVKVPAGLTSYQTTVDDSSSLNVDVSAVFDVLTGSLTWTFTSIDPATGDVPAGALTGFLPPDDAAGDGEGYIDYSVSPKISDASGTPIHSLATIVFDGNNPINTPNLLATVDAAAPTSTVSALLATQTFSTFLVTWSGQDDANGSGIAAYNIYVSDNGGTPTIWLADTTFTASTYIGTPGHTYGFYSVATDNAGNVQPTPSAAQATTSVAADATPAFAILTTGALVVTGTSGNDTVTLQTDGNGNLTATLNGQTSQSMPISQIASIDVEGEAGNDSITLGAGVPGSSVQGGPGNDTIQGGPGNDTLGGGKGADVITAGAGNDLIHGGAGADSILAGAGNDSIFGGLGNDTLRGGSGDDQLNGGAGTNIMHGGPGNNTIFYAVNGAEDQIFAGSATNDSLFYSTSDSPITESGTIPPGNKTLVS